ncbi:hypothetical protein LOK49_LG01G01823 [Camellia lanceoleosa]|uniref:Uncharacterized protein n=1 Tax=Camellia lanceoleosa TaxID=1840588 RepID=A0ACC0IWJ5_9ERIC|nr:hypothetical protein LOK49_LG01G01823 [Camellia lanceoleosa]
MLGVVASLEGMVLRREAQMSIMGFQMPPVYAPPRGGPPGPFQRGRGARPARGTGTQGAGPSRPYRGARGAGSSRRRRAPIVEDDEEEVADHVSEASPGEGGPGLGSGSGDEPEEDPEDDSSDPDGDEDAEIIPQKRMRGPPHSRSRGH